MKNDVPERLRYLYENHSHVRVMLLPYVHGRKTLDDALMDCVVELADQCRQLVEQEVRRLERDAVKSG
jgi:hypothetical protein